MHSPSLWFGTEIIVGLQLLPFICYLSFISSVLSYSNSLVKPVPGTTYSRGLFGAPYSVSDQFTICFSENKQEWYCRTKLHAHFSSSKIQGFLLTLWPGPVNCPHGPPGPWHTHLGSPKMEKFKSAPKISTLKCKNMHILHVLCGLDLQVSECAWYHFFDSFCTKKN
jgi:hypothetical protein